MPFSYICKLYIWNFYFVIIYSLYFHRLVMYMERDSRRQTPRDTKAEPAELEYLNQCLDLLINYMCDAVPSVMADILAALDAITGRKHPNTIQAKQLKNSLPLIHIFLHLVTSQVKYYRLKCLKTRLS